MHPHAYALGGIFSRNVGPRAATISDSALSFVCMMRRAFSRCGVWCVFPPREAATEFVVLALAELGGTRQLSLSGPLAAVVGRVLLLPRPGLWGLTLLV